MESYFSVARMKDYIFYVMRVRYAVCSMRGSTDGVARVSIYIFQTSVARVPTRLASESFRSTPCSPPQSQTRLSPFAIQRCHSCRPSWLSQKPFNPLADIATEPPREPCLWKDAVEVVRRTRVPTPKPLLVQSSQLSSLQSSYSRVKSCGDTSSFELLRVQHAHIARRVQAAHLYIRQRKVLERLERLEQGRELRVKRRRPDQYYRYVEHK